MPGVSADLEQRIRRAVDAEIARVRDAIHATPADPYDRHLTAMLRALDTVQVTITGPTHGVPHGRIIFYASLDCDRIPARNIVSRLADLDLTRAGIPADVAEDAHVEQNSHYTSTLTF